MKHLIIAAALLASSCAFSSETREVPVELLQDLEAISKSYVYEGHHNILSRQELLLIVHGLIQEGKVDELDSIMVAWLLESKEILNTIKESDSASDIHKMKAEEILHKIEGLE